MTRRTRLIAGIFAFLALTFSFGESVWASTCAPAVDMGSDATAASSEAPAMSDSMPDQDSQRQSEDERPCPFGSPAAVQACTGVVSLPAQVAVFFAPSFEGAPSVFTLETQSDLLMENALFRPPRA